MGLWWETSSGDIIFVVNALEASSDIAIRYLRRNFTLGVLNGALFQFSDALISPSLVLPLFVGYLTGSFLLVGLIPSILQAGFGTLFSLTLAFYALAIGLSLTLKDPREEIVGY